MVIYSCQLGSTKEGANTMHAEDKNLQLIESELKFIARHVQTVEGNYVVVDEVAMAAESALRALHEYKLSIQPDTTEEIPAGVGYPAAA